MTLERAAKLNLWFAPFAVAGGAGLTLAQGGPWYAGGAGGCLLVFTVWVIAEWLILSGPRDTTIDTTPEPEPRTPAALSGWTMMANDAPVLIPTQRDGRAGWAFDVTPEQWRALAARVAAGQLGLPVNQLSYHSKPFSEGEIKRFRRAAIEAGLAHETPTGRVYLNQRGRETVMLQAHSPGAG